MDLGRVKWRKSSHSSDNGGTCVEVGVWRKSSYSGNSGGACVEVTATRDTSAVLYLMRDSKDPDGPKLAFTGAEWDAFLRGVKDGEFDLAV